MKKKADSGYASRFYRGIKLYREHIELILSILEANGYRVSITDREFEYDSLDELIDKRGTTPSDFEITGKGNEDKHGNIGISFEKHRIYISSRSDGGESAYNVFTKIRDVCESHFSKLYRILNPWIYFFISFILFYLTLAVKTMGVDKASSIVVIGGWTSCAVVAVGLLLSGVYRNRRHEAILRREHVGDFWKRNSDKVWLLIVGALIGSLITLATAFITKWTK